MNQTDDDDEPLPRLRCSHGCVFGSGLNCCSPSNRSPDLILGRRLPGYVTARQCLAD